MIIKFKWWLARKLVGDPLFRSVVHECCVNNDSQNGQAMNPASTISEQINTGVWVNKTTAVGCSCCGGRGWHWSCEDADGCSCGFDGCPQRRCSTCHKGSGSDKCEPFLCSCGERHTVADMRAKERALAQAILKNSDPVIVEAADEERLNEDDSVEYPLIDWRAALNQQNDSD